MSISIPPAENDLIVMSLSELSRELRIPESRLNKAVREGVIKTRGSVGPARIVVYSDDELEVLRTHFHPRE
jgi:hypothetical protein